MKTQINIMGSAELQKAYWEISQGMRKKVMTMVVQKGARVMVPVIRRATPKSKPGTKSKNAKPSGTLRKSIGYIVKNTKAGKAASAYVGPRYGKGGNAAHLSDRGTVARWTKKGYFRGHVVGTQWFRNALATCIGPARQVMMNEMDAALRQVKARAAIRKIGKLAGTR